VAGQRRSDALRCHPECITGDGSKVTFSEGLYVGYRWYDQQNITPLFPFGYGLSYTQFEYSGLAIQPDRTAWR
jgi:beta-glucosidase